VSKRVAIVQSSYIPWKGYFDLIRHVDEFILFDDVQFTKRDWRNRNRIKTPQGPLWLSIPVQVKGRYLQAIKDTVVSDPAWSRTHWRTIRSNYAKAPFFPQFKDALEDLVEKGRDLEKVVLSRAVRWHIESRILLYDNKTVIFE